MSGEISGRERITTIILIFTLLCICILLHNSLSFIFISLSNCLCKASERVYSHFSCLFRYRSLELFLFLDSIDRFGSVTNRKSDDSKVYSLVTKEIIGQFFLFLHFHSFTLQSTLPHTKIMNITWQIEKKTSRIYYQV